MALFGWKKSEGPAAGAAGGGDKEPPKTATADEFQPDPEKARKWFEHAKVYAETFNYDGALFSYANGIKLDPEAMSAHEGMWEAAVKYMNTGGKPASGKEIRNIEDSHPVSRFAAAEFAWMKEISNASLALKAIEAAVKARQLEFGHWAAPKVLNIMLRAKKQSKGMLVKAKDLFKEVHAWNEALEAGQRASMLDPTDNELAHEIKDISAQRAMDQGGYEKAAGKEGGYRSFVKDTEKQRQLIEQEAIVTSQSAEERNLLRAKAEYEKNPLVPDVVNQYAQLVKKQGTPEAEKLAHDIYMKGFADTGEYRFRMYAGDIKIEQARRQVEAALVKATENPTDQTLQEQAESLRKQLADYEATEFVDRVAKYPTNREMKLRLGEIEFARGNFGEAIKHLQSTRDEPKLRVRALHMLGRAFAAEGWHPEAVSEFKAALDAIEVSDKERELQIQYELMASLIELARLERDAGMAKEALEICSGIARKDITYRDIRTKRKEVDQLMRELSGAGG